MSKVTAAEVTEFLNSPEIDTILVKNQDKFKAKWAAMIEKGEDITPATSISWNWATFFLQDYWVLHRKMYSVFWALFVIRVVCFIGTISLPAMNMLFSIIGFCVWIGITLLGNGLYLDKTLKLYKQAQAQFGGHAEGRHEFLRKSGGTSIIFPILLLLFTIVSFTLGVLYAVGSMAADGVL